MNIEVTFLLFACTAVVVFLLFFTTLRCRWLYRLRDMKKPLPEVFYRYSLSEFLGLEMECELVQPRRPFVS